MLREEFLLISLPLVKRDNSLIFNNYKLSTIATYFVGESKDPLGPERNFQVLSRIGIKTNEKGEYSSKAQRAMGTRCPKYCVQDSNLSATIDG